MKSASPIGIVLAVSTLLFAQNTKAASTDTTAFDGTWSVTLDAKAFKNPDGRNGLPYVSRFSATGATARDVWRHN